MRLRRIGLTNRLVALLVALLVVSGVVVGVATTVALRGFLIGRLDQQLTAAGVRYSLSLEHPDADHHGGHDADDATFNSTVGQAAGTLGARALHGTVTSIGVVDAGPGRAPSQSDRAVLGGLAVSAQPRTVHLPQLGSYRVSVQAGRDGDVLITGLPTRDIDRLLTHLIEVETLVFGVVIAVAALIGAGVIRRGLGPLQRIASAAEDVSALPLTAGGVTLPAPLDNPRPATEIGTVTTAFNLMLVRVQAALEQRHDDEENLRHFIADASHELRTPVAVISSQAQYAQNAAHLDPDAVPHALHRITAEAARMGHLVDDLLLLTQLDLRRPVTREPVDLTRIVLDAVTDATRVAPDHQWRLDLPEQPVTVLGDTRTLHQAVANLLANARTHTPPGTTVATRLRVSASTVEVSVHDDGPGVEPELLPHVFERFTRADQSRAHTEGAGLGLTITEGIAHAHRGTLTVHSVPGNTTFTLHLPPMSPEPPENDAPAVGTASLTAGDVRG